MFSRKWNENISQQSKILTFHSGKNGRYEEEEEENDEKK